VSIWTRFLARSLTVEQTPYKSQVTGSIPVAPTNQVSRRAFLAGALTAPVIARTFFGPPQGGWPVERYVFETKGLAYKATERYAHGFTDPRGVYGSRGIMTAAEFRKIVEPELNRIFSDEYAKHSDEWEQVFGDGVALNSIPHPELHLGAVPEDLDESTLETIEIDIREPILIKPGRRWFR
jgi:hypothetical protein